MDYVLFGIQGAGKGTQGKILIEKIGGVYFETGGELRRLSSENSLLGEKVKSIITAGKLVPNEVVMEIVEDFITHISKEKVVEESLKNDELRVLPIIFDGIPRNQEQSDTFTALLDAHARDFIGLYFELPRQQAEYRLINRRICKNCKTVYPAVYSKNACEKCSGELITRADDNAEAIQTRINIFYNETLPVIENWKTKNCIISINADQPIEAVTKEMFNKLRN